MWSEVVSPEFLASATGFLLFFLAASFAVYFHHSSQVRRLYVVIFFVMLLSPVVGVSLGWPMSSWALFGEPAPTHVTTYEVRIADAGGYEIRYDAHAAPPVTSTVLHQRYTEQIVSREDEYALRLGRYLLERSREYREQVEKGRDIGRWVRFPRHQLGYQWNRDDLQDIGRFEEIRIYRHEYTVSKDGHQVNDLSNRLVIVVNESTVTRYDEVDR